MLGGRAKFAVVLGLVLLVSSVCFSQNITALATGTVTDPSGAVVSGATVIVHNDNTNTVVATVKTDSSGVYTVNELPASTYTVTVKAQDAIAGEPAWSQDARHLAVQAPY